MLKTSPDVTVKNASFDAFLTNKRIIFAKKTDDLYEKKELVFPLNLIKKYEPRADQAGTPTIEFSIQKPDGGLGDLILRFTQTGEYRYSERDDWVEKLKRAVPSGPDMQYKNSGFKPPQRPPESSQNLNFGQVPVANRGFPAPPPAAPEYNVTQPGTVPLQRDPFTPAPHHNRPQQPAEQARFHTEGRPPAPPGGAPVPPSAGQGIPVNPSFCRFCGGNIPAGSAFCPSCGQRAGSDSPARQGYERPPVPPLNQRPPVPPASGTYTQRHSHGPSYGAQTGGFSLADDPEYANRQSKKRGRPPSPNKSQKAEQKAFRQAEKQRKKEEKLAEKERKKAMKRGKSDSYDPYDYRESRIPQGLPKIIGIVLAVVIVLAVAAFAVNSGMLSGSGSASPSTGTDATVSPTTATGDYTPGTTTVSESFGTWNIQIIYSGQWSGSYSVNGVETTITDDDGNSEMYGYKQITLDNPSGTIEATIQKDESGTGVLMVDILNQKGQYASSESTSASYGTVTASASVT